MKKVCLYYHYPIAINEAWDVSKAVDIYKNYVTIQPSRKEYHKKECSFSEVLLVNVMKIESYFPLKWFQYFR